jgi:hypothetical protein
MTKASELSVIYPALQWLFDSIYSLCTDILYAKVYSTLVEWELSEETWVLSETLSKCQFAHQKSHVTDLR